MKEKDRGLAVSMLYVTSISSQIVVAVGFGSIISIANENVAVTLLLGGICLLVAGVLSIPLTMKQPDINDEKLS